MFQSNFQQPNVMYQGGKNKKRNMDQSMISNVYPGYKQNGYAQNYQLMPPYYPQYMQENITANGSSFLKAFSHFPLLPSSMSTNAKGICGLLTTLLFTILVIVVVALTPLYIKAANKSLKTNVLNTNGTTTNEETGNQEFSIDLKNAIQLETSSLAQILALPINNRTTEQRLSLKSAISKLTEQLNDKTIPKLNSDIKEIYNVRLSPQSDDLISVSYTIKTKKMSEEKGNTLRIELDGKLENLDLYENIVLQSNSKLNHILPTKNETMSNLIKGDVLQISEFNRVEPINVQNYQPPFIPETTKSIRYEAPVIKENTDYSNRNDYNNYHSELEDLKDGPILYPLPYEQNYNDEKTNQNSDENKQIVYEDDSYTDDTYNEKENDEYRYDDDNKESYRHQEQKNTGNYENNMDSYEYNEQYYENNQNYPETVTSTHMPNVTDVLPFRWRLRDIRKTIINKRKSRRDLIRSRKLVRALINLRKRIRNRRLQPFRVASNVPRKANENLRQVFLRRRIAVLEKRLVKLNEFRSSCTLPVLQGAKSNETIGKDQLKGFLVPDGIRPKSILARFRNRQVIRGLRRLKENLLDERKKINSITTTKGSYTTKYYKPYENNNQKSNYNGQKSEYNNYESDYNDQKNNYNDQKSNYNGQKSDYSDQKTNYNDQKSNYNVQKSDYNDQKSNYIDQQSNYNDDYYNKNSYNVNNEYIAKTTTTASHPTTTTHRMRFKFIIDEDQNSIPFLQRRVNRIRRRIRRVLNRISKCIKNNTFLKATTTPKPSTESATVRHDDNYSNEYSGYVQENNGYEKNNVYLKSELNLQLGNNGSNSTLSDNSTANSTMENTTIIN